jgi:hypothetical protein
LNRKLTPTPPQVLAFQLFIIKKCPRLRQKSESKVSGKNRCDPHRLDGDKNFGNYDDGLRVQMRCYANLILDIFTLIRFPSSVNPACASGRHQNPYYEKSLLQEFHAFGMPSRSLPVTLIRTMYLHRWNTRYRH